MITKPIVLVLGAGASKPYDFPIGSELKTKILTHRGQNRYPDNLTEALHRKNITSEKYSAFLNDFWKAGPVTIDSFLETRAEHQEAGKIAIAFALIHQENESTLFDSDSTKGKWYDYLFEKMYYVMGSDGIHRPVTLDEFGTNQISVITFNYDRSFEHYLFTLLCNLTNAPPTQVAEVVNRFRIIHVYGQLGFLPFQTTDPKITRSYEMGMASTEITKAASGIKLIHERRDISDTLPQIIDLLATAEYVFFLGFGYHPENVRKLGLVEARKITSHGIWSGTAYMLTREEIQYGLQAQFKDIHYRDQAILPFLRSAPEFLSLK